MCNVEFLLKHQDSLLTKSKSKTSDSSSFLLQVVIFFRVHDNIQLNRKLHEKHCKKKVLDYAFVVKKIPDSV